MTAQTPIKKPSTFDGLKAVIRAQHPKEPEAIPVERPEVKPYVRKPKPLRRVGTARDLSLFAGWRPGGFLLDDRGVINSQRAGTVIHGRGRPAVRSVELMIARLASYGVRLATTPNGQVCVLSERGEMPSDMNQQILGVWPLLSGFVLGHPLGCAWCKEPAVDVLLGGAPVCATHADEEIKP